MLAEVLLVLGGHTSSFFVPSPPAPHAATTHIVSPSLAEHLHPGEVASLNSLGSLAFRYRHVRTWAQDVQARGREAILAESLSSSRKGKQRQVDELKDAPDQYLSTLASSVLDVLAEYELLIVQIEAKILASDLSLVQDHQSGYVPLSSLVASFDRWQAPLSALSHMVDQLSHRSPTRDQARQPSEKKWTPGRLQDLLNEKSQTGNPFLEKIFLTLSSSLKHLFLTHLVSFLLYGLAPSLSTPTSPSIALDIGADPLSPQHRSYVLNDQLLPLSIKSKTRESILYVGRVASTLKREGRRLPKTLVDGLRGEIMSVPGLEKDGALDDAVQRARAEVGEWLWKHILTGPQVADSIEVFANYFLTRKADYAISVIRELSRLRLEKLITSNPHSSSSVIREQDLDLALLRASVGTSAQIDKALEQLRFKMEQGPLRAILPSLPSKASRKDKSQIVDTGDNHENGVRRLFSSSLLGTPITLQTSITWPLDLFMTPPAISAYSNIHSYLISIRDTHLRVLNCWTSLSAAQRRRRKWTGVTEGGVEEEVDARKRLARIAWGAIRAMLFFLDQLQGHFMVDIIDVQHRQLLEQLDLVEGTGSLQTYLTGSTSLRGSRTGSIRPASPTTTFHRSLGHGTTSRAPSTFDVRDRRPDSPYSDTQAGFDAQTTRSNRAPPTPSQSQATYVDFLALRQMHARHLSFLREGLLLSDIQVATTIRDILDTCKRFTGLVERWGGDVLPELLMEGVGGEEVGRMVKERMDAVKEITDTLHDQLVEFFGTLLDHQNPPQQADPDKSSGGGTSFSKTSRIAHISRMMSRRSSFSGIAANIKSSSGQGFGAKNKADVEKEERGLEAEAVMARHIEQLLLRLDFNGVLTAWRMKEHEETLPHSVLAEGGL